jgi:hypothetical protein
MAQERVATVHQAIPFGGRKLSEVVADMQAQGSV